MKFKTLLVSSLSLNWALIAAFWIYQGYPKETPIPEQNVSHEDVLKDWKPYVVIDEETQKREEVFAHTEPTVEPNRPSEIENPVAEKESDSQIYTSGMSIETPVFKISEIPKAMQDTLNALVTPDPEIITYDKLRLITVTHWGFDGTRYIGELIVHREVAEDVISIFMEVYEAHYPIEKIKLISNYENSDGDSMTDNNTSAFNYRAETAGKNLSAHAYGLAIDVNPKYNPYISDDRVLPANGVLYVERETNSLGMIQPGDALHQAFTSRGWTWGGDWENVKDYQHFSKRID